MNAFAHNAFSRPSAFTSAFGVAGASFEGRVLYFVGTAADEDWSTLGNWFNDRAGTSAAASIPEAGDRVYLLYPIGTGPAAPITLERVFIEGQFVNLDGITASRFAFSGVGADFFGTITGPVLVYWPVVVPLTGTVTGTISYIGYAQDPTGFVAIGADSIVNLTWDDPGIDAVVGLRYRVYRGLTSTFADATLLVEDVDALLYDDAAVTNDTEYFYWLQVYYSNGASAFVGPESATPAAPAGLPAVTSGTLLGDWDAALITGLADGDPAPTFPDGSGNSLDGSQATGANRAEYIAADPDFNNFPSLAFDGVNDDYVTPAFESGDTTMFFVCIRDWGDLGAYRVLCTKNYLSSLPTNGLYVGQTGETALDWTSGDLIAFGDGFASGQSPRCFGSGVGLTGPQVIRVTLAVGVAKIWANGVLISTSETIGNSIPINTESLHIGTDIVTGWWDGSLTRMLKYSTLSEPDGELIENYLMGRYVP